MQTQDSRLSGERGPVGRCQQLGPDRQAKRGDIWVLWGETLCLVGLKNSDGAAWGQWDVPLSDDVLRGNVMGRAGAHGHPSSYSLVQYFIEPLPRARHGPHPAWNTK